VFDRTASIKNRCYYLFEYDRASIIYTSQYYAPSPAYALLSIEAGGEQKGAN